ncbi:MAG: T9SS type A sorting domain-containing protein, partial [Flavobacteriales bacterium]|nr:T9SS type A sorting domain-containing protein [Flavobacteriales bacterium]
NAQVLLYDANGKLVSSTMATLSNTVRVSTTDLPDGIYSLRVQQGDALTVHRIVVAH